MNAFSIPRVLALTGWLAACVGLGLLGAYAQQFGLERAAAKANLEWFWMAGLFVGILILTALNAVLTTARRGVPSLMRYLRGQETWRNSQKLGDHQAIIIDSSDRRLMLLSWWPFFAISVGFVVGGVIWAARTSAGG